MDGAALLAEENIVGDHNTKTEIVVVVVWVVPVANRAPGVVSIVVPRTAAHHTGMLLNEPFTHNVPKV